MASAEHIQRTIEQHTKDRMREEVREIKQTFRHQRKSDQRDADVHAADPDTNRATAEEEIEADNERKRHGSSKRSSRRNSIAA